MKTWKKNLVAAAVLVTVCAGIYVNWLYTEENAAADLTDSLDVEKVMSDDLLVLGEDTAVLSGEGLNTTASDYFAAVRLSRQEARDSALELLQEAMSYSDSTKAAESTKSLEEIVDAIEARDINRCVELTKQHLQTVKEHILIGIARGFCPWDMNKVDTGYMLI